MDSFGVGCFTGIFLLVVIQVVLNSSPHECMVTVTDTQGTKHVSIGVTK
jgi:hypothetical protein